MSKALLIKSQIDKNGGEVGKWNNFNNAPSYIQGYSYRKNVRGYLCRKTRCINFWYTYSMGKSQTF